MFKKLIVSRKILIACCAVLAAGAAVALLLLLPPVQSLVILFAGKVLGRALDAAHWHRELCVYALLLFLCICLAAVCVFMFASYNTPVQEGAASRRRKLDAAYAAYLGLLCICMQPSVSMLVLRKTADAVPAGDIRLLFFLFRGFFLCSLLEFICIRWESLKLCLLQPAAEIVQPLCTRQNLRVFLACAAFLFFCYVPLLLAQSGQSPTDTERLFLTGSTDAFCTQFRYASAFLLKFLHMSASVYNSTPLMQMIGIVELAVVMIVFAHTCTGEGKPSLLTLLAALPAVLSPWFITNMGYVHDACLHPLAMLTGILPFLFCGHTAVFIMVSFACNYLMCLLYQLASGVYIVMALYCALMQYLRGQKSFGQACAFTGIAALSYLVPLGLYEFGLFYSRPWNDYATAVLPSSGSIVLLVLRNAGTYLSFLREDLGSTVLHVVYVLISAGGMLAAVVHSKRGRLVSALLVLLVFAAGLVLSFGVSLALEQPLWLPRAFIGIGVFVSLQACSFIELRDVPLFRRAVSPAIALCSFCLVLYAYTYGAAMYQQRLYADVRLQSLAADLNELHVPCRDAAFYIEGGVGFAPSVTLAARTYPLLSRSMHERAAGTPTAWLLAVRGIGVAHLYDLSTVDFPLLKDTSFYAIYGDGLFYKIVLKEG